MEQYIPKSALVAGIEELISNGKLKCQQSQENNDPVSYTAWSEHIATCGKILSFINTLEVKKVDNVWHDASETPKGAGDKEILVQFSDWHTSVLEIDDWEYLDHQTKWAYLKDLL